jgi:hypothetical protein
MLYGVLREQPETRNQSLKMKVKQIVLILTSLAWLASGQTTQAGTHLWSGAVDGYWSNPANCRFQGVGSVLEQRRAASFAAPPGHPAPVQSEIHQRT